MQGQQQEAPSSRMKKVHSLDCGAQANTTSGRSRPPQLIHSVSIVVELANEAKPAKDSDIVKEAGRDDHDDDDDDDDLEDDNDDDDEECLGSDLARKVVIVDEADRVFRGRAQSAEPRLFELLPRPGTPTCHRSESTWPSSRHRFDHQLASIRQPATSGGPTLLMSRRPRHSLACCSGAPPAVGFLSGATGGGSGSELAERGALSKLGMRRYTHHHVSFNATETPKTTSSTEQQSTSSTVVAAVAAVAASAAAPAAATTTDNQANAASSSKFPHNLELSSATKEAQQQRKAAPEANHANQLFRPERQSIQGGQFVASQRHRKASLSLSSSSCSPSSPIRGHWQVSAPTSNDQHRPAVESAHQQQQHHHHLQAQHRRQSLQISLLGGIGALHSPAGRSLTEEELRGEREFNEQVRQCAKSPDAASLAANCLRRPSAVAATTVGLAAAAAVSRAANSKERSTVGINTAANLKQVDKVRRVSFGSIDPIVIDQRRPFDLYHQHYHHHHHHHHHHNNNNSNNNSSSSSSQQNRSSHPRQASSSSSSSSASSAASKTTTSTTGASKPQRASISGSFTSPNSDQLIDIIAEDSQFEAARKIFKKLEGHLNERPPPAAKIPQQQQQHKRHSLATVEQHQNQLNRILGGRPSTDVHEPDRDNSRLASGADRRDQASDMTSYLVADENNNHDSVALQGNNSLETTATTTTSTTTTTTEEMSSTSPGGPNDSRRVASIAGLTTKTGAGPNQDTDMTPTMINNRARRHQSKSIGGDKDDSRVQSIMANAKLRQEEFARLLEEHEQIVNEINRVETKISKSQTHLQEQER